MTALDKALSEACANAENSSNFYNLFLNSDLYLPLSELPSASSPQSIVPILIESSGSKYLMLFDEVDRLVDWAKREIPFAQIPGHAILQMMDPSVLYVLNVGTEYMHEFVVDEVAWLRSVVQGQSNPAGNEAR